MALDPEALLACVARMNVEQKTRFCELIDPAPGPDDGLERGLIVKPYTPVFQPPGPRMVAWLLGGKSHLERQTTHKALEPPVADRKTDWDQWAAEELDRCGFGLADQTKTPVEIEPPLPADGTGPVDPDPSVRQDRWVRAQDRWERLFRQGPIPMIRKSQGLESDLVLIETMLYDKETKGLNPTRCACGCNYVIGCLQDHSF